MSIPRALHFCAALLLLSSPLRAADAVPHPYGYLDPITPEPDRALPGPCELTGQILDPAGKPAPNVTLFFSNESLAPTLYEIPNLKGTTWPTGRSSPPYVTSDANGRFSFNMMYAGRTDLFAQTPTAAAWLRDLDSDAKNITLQLAPRNDTLTFGGAILDTDATTPVPNARLFLFTEEQNGPVQRAETRADATGHYRFQLKPDWSPQTFLWLIAVPEHKTMAWCVLPCISGSNLNVQLRPECTLTGRVLNDAQAPLTNARIAVSRPNNIAFGSLWDSREPIPPLFATTDANGQYTLHGLPRGSLFHIFATHDDCQGGGILHLSATGDSQALADIRLPRAVAFEGIVTRNDKPVENATVTFSGTRPQSATTDARGHYRITSISPYRGHIDKLITARSPTPPDKAPEFDAETYYEFPVQPGELVNLNLALQPSIVAHFAKWNQLPGNPIPATASLLLLDDADPVYEHKTSYQDTLSLRDPAGKTLWQKSGLNTYHPRDCTLAFDPASQSVWVGERFLSTSLGRLLRYSRTGELLSEIPDVKPAALALDPETHNLWVLTSAGSWAGEKLLVFSPEGKQLHEFPLPGAAIAYNALDDSFWIVGKDYKKVARDGSIIVTGEQFPWFATALAVNPIDGSVWIAEGRHSQVPGSAGQIHIIDPDGAPRKNISFDLDYKGVLIDAPRKTAWLLGYKRLVKTDLEGNPLAEIPIPPLNASLEPDTGCLWVCTDKTLYRLDPQGRPLSSQPSPTSKALLSLPPTPPTP